jgi:hypothetical protein
MRSSSVAGSAAAVLNGSPAAWTKRHRYPPGPEGEPQRRCCSCLVRGVLRPRRGLASDRQGQLVECYRHPPGHRFLDGQFVWPRRRFCTSAWPHQLEVFDGASDPAAPRRIALLIPAARTFNKALLIRSLSFAGPTVTVDGGSYADNDATCYPSRRVHRVFAWTGDQFRRRCCICGEGARSRQTAAMRTRHPRPAFHCTVRVRWLLLSTRGDRARGLLVSAVRPVLPPRRGAPRPARDRGRQRQDLSVGAAVHATAG